MSLKASNLLSVCIQVMPTGMMFLTNDIGNCDKHFDDEYTIVQKQTIIRNNYLKANNYHKQLS